MGLVLIQDGGYVFDVLFEIRSTTGDELLSYGEEANFYLKGSTITIMSSLHWDENDDTFVFFRQMMNCNVLISLVRTKEGLIIYVGQ